MADRSKHNTPSHQSREIPTTLAESERFAPPKSRRDFLGIAAVWSALATFVVAAVGAMRLPMPSVFPESNSKSRIGPPDAFKKGSATHLPELRAWVFRDEDGGLYAVSSVCTHLGCIAERKEDGEFLCPCHGSRFSENGKVLAGPAPSALHWLEITMAPDGELIVDQQRSVAAGTRFMA